MTRCLEFKPGHQAEANPGELLELAVKVDGLGGSAPESDGAGVSPPEAVPAQKLGAAHMLHQQQAPAGESPKGHVEAGEVGRHLEKKAQE